MARRRRKTDITLWDHVRLEEEFLSRPRFVLRHFKRCQIGSLIELPIYLKILQEQPQKAVEIALVAANMGIRIGDEDIDQGDVLASMTPGEV